MEVDTGQGGMKMAQFVDVAVRLSGDVLTCDPETVQLEPTRPGAPSEVAWTLEDAPTARKLEIQWKDQSPFRTMSTSASGQRVEGLDNTGEVGEYPYTVVVRDAAGQVVARLDPKIVNRPWP